MSETCPVCNSKVSDSKEVSIAVLGVPGYYYSCPRCGNYQIEGFTLAQIKSLLGDRQRAAILSHWIRTKYEAMNRDAPESESIILTPDLIKNIVRQSPPSCAEQANRFVLWLGNSKHPPGELIFVRAATHQSIMGAVTPEGFKLVLDYLLERRLLGPQASSGPDGLAKIALTVQGWEYYEELRRGAVESRKAFMAMEYGHSDLDNVFENLLRPAVKQTGFDLFILPERPMAGLIDDRLRVEIRTSRFLIADLTHENGGAYWEAGYAEGLGRPVIYTCEEKKFEELKTHFDTNHHLTIKWDANTADKLKRTAEELKATIRATLPAEAKLTDD
jgi:hypothetical protein